MVKGDNRAVALLDIAPKYAEAIFSGEKTVEFRRTQFARNVGTVVLYATVPLKQVIGYFDIKGINCGRPSVLWREYGKRGMISRAAFEQYYSGCTEGVAIEVENARRFVRPMSLEGVNGSTRPPQSFLYLKKQEWQKLKSKKVAAEPDNAPAK